MVAFLNPKISDTPYWLLPSPRFDEVDYASLTNTDNIINTLKKLYKKRANLAVALSQHQSRLTCFLGGSFPSSYDAEEIDFSALIAKHLTVVRSCDRSELLNNISSFGRHSSVIIRKAWSNESLFSLSSILSANRDIWVVMCVVPIPGSIVQDRLTAAFDQVLHVRERDSDLTESNAVLERVSSKIEDGFWQRAVYCFTEDDDGFTSPPAGFSKVDISSSDLRLVALNFVLIVEKQNPPLLDFLRDYRYLDPIDSEQLAKCLTH